MLSFKYQLLLLIIAVVESIRGWTIGHGYKYEITTIVLSRESGISKSGGDVGFQLTGEITVNPVWQDPKDLETILLEIEVGSIFLSILFLSVK